MFKTLALETSCDDTSLGIISFDKNIFIVNKLISYSQILQHATWGGVVPEIASRLHSEQIINLLREIDLDQFTDLDFISVTKEPGLSGSLLVGINTANFLGAFLNKPVIKINHIYGHICSLFLERDISTFQFPGIILTASGGHNDIYLINGINLPQYELIKIGTTLDDAAGESFDKVSRMLGGPYPGGKWIADHALLGRKNELIKFKKILLDKEKYDFSFSGMKSQVYNLIQKLSKQNINLTEQLINDICRAFQETVVAILSFKTLKAAEKYQVKFIGIAGGVSANDRLYSYLTQINYLNIPVYIPTQKIYSTDNAAMIGVAGILKYSNLITTN